LQCQLAQVAGENSKMKQDRFRHQSDHYSNIFRLGFKGTGVVLTLHDVPDEDMPTDLGFDMFLLLYSIRIPIPFLPSL